MDRQHFFDRGYVYVRDAFSADAAAAMRTVVWDALVPLGIRRDAPATWIHEAPSHLQTLKGAPEFRAVGSETTIAAIDELLGVDGWQHPTDWGAFFLLFPMPRPWFVPTASWHCDHAYDLPLTPLTELKVHAMFGDVAPRAGGMTIVAGSHHLVARHVADHPPDAGESAARTRKAIMRGVPYLRDLETQGDGEARIARFVDRAEDVDGVRCQVVELTATAGDVILMHPLLLHTRPTNAGTQPRFLLNKDIYRS